MNNHPLQFFKDIIEDDKTINVIKDKFYSSYHGDMILELDREREFVRIMNPFDSESESIVRYFHHYLKEACYDGMHQCLKQIENDVLHAGDAIREKHYLNKVINEIDLLLSKELKRDDLGKYPFISNILGSIKECILYNYKLVEKNNSPTLLQVTPKIQWLSNINILTTLFYDLLNGIKSDNIQPLIKATPKDVERLIVENFIDQDGNEFQMGSTIKDYLKPSKQSTKRAKGEIYIKVGKI